VDRIQSTLSSDVDSLFTTILHALTDVKTTEIERSKHLMDLVECLRTYDMLKLWADAEDLLRRELVRPFVRKVSARVGNM
jgi:conserved oligomeric Golgi complex subunit 2